MRLFVAVTDDAWFRFHAERKPDEVNFWRPRSTMGFHAIQCGEPFLFKLHSPANYIVGGGFFVQHSVLPISLAWKAFGEKNGMLNYSVFRSRVVSLGKRTELDPFIGCTILTHPFFFSEDQWIPAPDDWSRNVVVGKGYDSQSAVGMKVWQQVKERIAQALPSFVAKGDIDQPQYGKAFLTKGRIGQGAFRVMVTEAYDRRCAISGERTLPVLEASHIMPYADGGPNLISNGLLLRSDLHILYDGGYLAVTKDMRVEVSGKIKEEFENGKLYYQYHGNTLMVLPHDEEHKPSAQFIEWHNLNRYAS